jgi:hypothetical protein
MFPPLVCKMHEYQLSGAKSKLRKRSIFHSFAVRTPSVLSVAQFLAGKNEKFVTAQFYPLCSHLSKDFMVPKVMRDFGLAVVHEACPLSMPNTPI